MTERESILLIVSPGFPANEADSSCLPAQQQLIMAMNQLAPSQKICIISFQYPYEKRSYQWMGNTVFALGGKNKKQISRLFTWLKAWRQMRRLSEQYRINTVFCFWYGECSFIGKLFAKKHRLPFYVWILGQDALPGNKYCRWTRPVAKELLSISDAVSDQFSRNYHIQPAYILPNAILPSLCSRETVEKDIDIMGAGSLIPLKQYRLFVEVIGRLQKTKPSIKAVLCGEGECLQELQEQIRAAGLEKNILLTGACSHNETISMMHRAKIFLHPSAYEGFSGACLEALYAGAQVISFCRPMHGWIRNWQVVSDTGEMTNTCLTILNDSTIVYKPVLPYNMLNNAQMLLDLFS